MGRGDLDWVIERENSEGEYCIPAMADAPIAASPRMEGAIFTWVGVHAHHAIRVSFGSVAPTRAVDRDH